MSPSGVRSTVVATVFVAGSILDRLAPSFPTIHTPPSPTAISAGARALRLPGGLASIRATTRPAAPDGAFGGQRGGAVVARERPRRDPRPHQGGDPHRRDDAPTAEAAVRGSRGWLR